MDELLDNFQRSLTPEAFGQIVQRHLAAVYSQALRRVRDPGTAQDVAQAVFILLHRKARSLPRNVVLGAWLFRATQYACLNARRTEQRRRRHEREAAVMRQELAPEQPDAELHEILDQAIGRLSRSDREAVLLRYYEGRSLAEVGERLGIAEDAARKRLSRAIERLREIAQREGITASSVAVTGALEAAFKQVPPTHLAGTITAAATGAAVPSAGVSLIVKGVCHMMLMGKAQLAAAILIALAVLFAIPFAVHATQTSATTRPVAAMSSPAAQDAQPGAPVPADVQQAVNDTMVRLLQAIRADDLPGVRREIYSGLPDDQNLLLATTRLDMAVLKLKATRAKAYPNSTPFMLEQQPMISEMIQRSLSIEPQATTFEMRDGFVITRSKFDPEVYFGEHIGAIKNPEQWVNAPNYFRKVDDHWAWDIDRSLKFVTTPPPATPEEAQSQRRVGVRVMDALTTLTRTMTKEIGAGKYANSRDANAAMNRGMGESIAKIPEAMSGTLQMDMVPAK